MAKRMSGFNFGLSGDRHLVSACHLDKWNADASHADRADKRGFSLFDRHNPPLPALYL